MVRHATPTLTLSFSDAGPNSIVDQTIQEEENRSISADIEAPSPIGYADRWLFQLVVAGPSC